MNPSDMSKRASKGQSLARIEKLLNNGVCSCGCRVPVRDLLAVCRCFWGLPKAAQDAVLWSIQSEGVGRRNTWTLEGSLAFLENLERILKFSLMPTVSPHLVSSVRSSASGHQVCRHAWLRYLGVGKERIMRCKRTYHGVDKRTLSCHGGRFDGTHIIYWFICC